MKRYKHYSFDLWLTLIKSNPEFKIERAKYLYKYYNPFDHTLESVQNIIREVDVMCNQINELVGKNIDAYEMYAMVLFKMGFSINSVGVETIYLIYRDIEKILDKYPPVVYDNDTIAVLTELSKSNSTISVTSNTGFIKGYTLVQHLESLQIKKYTNFLMFSDESCISKPDIEIFIKMRQNARRIWGSTLLNSSDIIHIGDNPIADIEGATKAGINAFQINSNDKTIKDLL